MDYRSSLPRVWPELQPELTERIACCLSRNEQACSLRLVSRAAAEHFRAVCGPQPRIRLSKRVPSHAFARHWRDPGATHGLSLKQRQLLQQLTAASGSIRNLTVALASTDCPPSKQLFMAPAAKGKLAVCQWLLQRSNERQARDMLAAAAQAEQMHVIEWIMGMEQQSKCGPCFAVSAVAGAARGGRTRLLQQLLRDHACAVNSLYSWDLKVILAGAAHGCDLLTLQRLHADWVKEPGAWDDSDDEDVWYDLHTSSPGEEGSVLAAAAGSPTADWQAKVEWLEGRGHQRNFGVCCKAARDPADAVGRLMWLRQRGYPVIPAVAPAAAQAGNLAALQYLHAEGAGLDGVARDAAGAGHLHVVAWLVETPGVAAPLTPVLFDAAARSGSLELMAWLHERGCPWDGTTFTAAAAGGSQAALEWLVERGCPMPEEGTPYHMAAVNGDLATLRGLRRLGCPWGPVGKVIGRGKGWMYMTVQGLRWLLEEGCPVDWDAARKCAKKLRCDKVSTFLLDLLEVPAAAATRARTGSGIGGGGNVWRVNGSQDGSTLSGEGGRSLVCCQGPKRG